MGAAESRGTDVSVIRRGSLGTVSEWGGPEEDFSSDEESDEGIIDDGTRAPHHSHHHKHTHNIIPSHTYTRRHVHHWIPVNGGISGTEKNGLAKFYRGTSGDRWRTHKGWLRHGPVGLWCGVIVENRKVHKSETAVVVGITLPQNRLRGDFNKLGVELAKLHHLEVIHLSSNKLKGTLPPSLTYCERLRELILDDNNFSGTVPIFLGAFPYLTKVDLSRNLLSGEISERLIGQFADRNIMEFVDLNFNDIEGEVHDAWGDIVSLKELGLGANNFTGVIPNSICSLSKLKRLDLHENLLSGTLPDNFSHLTTLRELRLHGNEYLAGDVPPELMEVGKLDVISTNFNVTKYS